MDLGTLKNAPSPESKVKSYPSSQDQPQVDVKAGHGDSRTERGVEVATLEPVGDLPFAVQQAEAATFTNVIIPLDDCLKLAIG